MPQISKQTPTVRKKTGSVIDRIGEGWGGNFLKILLYGQSGTGKTTLWATFPGPILAIICSGSRKPGEMKSIDTPEYRKKIQPVVLYDSAECKQLVEHVQETGRYKTVVLDHVSGLQDLTLKEILGLDELPAQKGWGLAKQDQWGQSTLQCKEIIRSLLALDTNVVIIGQERESEPKEDSEIQLPHVGVATTPSLAGWLNPAVDYICQTFKRAKMVERRNKIGGKEVVTMERGKGVEFCLRTAPHDIFTTKFRKPKGKPLPELIVDADYNKIMTIITG